jgi:CheY-like chemotaxis protein
VCVAETWVTAIVDTLTLRDLETVLVVDDDPGSRIIVTRMLAKYGYRVLEAAGSVQALERFAQGGAVDLLVTDVMMPRVNGPELAGELISRQPQLRVLFMSADETKVRMSRDFPFLQKPFLREELLGAVRLALDCPPHSTDKSSLLAGLVKSAASCSAVAI